MNNPEFAAKVIAAQTIDKLYENLISLKKEMFNLRFQQALGELKNTSRFTFVRKTVARLNTELTKRLKTGE